jgi:hypothetical protein
MMRRSIHVIASEAKQSRNLDTMMVLVFAISVWKRGSNQIVVEILPTGVETLNQRQLLRTAARLDLLFARDGLDHAVMKFVPHQQLTAVLP